MQKAPSISHPMKPPAPKEGFLVKVSLFEEHLIVATAEVRKICKGTQSCFVILHQQNTSLKFRVITVESCVVIVPISSKKMIQKNAFWLRRNPG